MNVNRIELWTAFWATLVLWTLTGDTFYRWAALGSLVLWMFSGPRSTRPIDSFRRIGHNRRTRERAGQGQRTRPTDTNGRAR
jgi:hypothetical protein